MLSINSASIRYRRDAASDTEPFSIHVEPCEVPAGSLVVAVGPNGSGKTTFLLALGGFGDRLAGDQQPFAHWAYPDGTRRPASEVSTVLQVSPAFFPTMTVQRYLRLSKYTRDRPPNDDEVAASLDRWQIPSRTRRRTTESLSAGQRQRLGLARLSLQQHPLLILMDEPRANLDDDGDSLVDSFVSDARNRGRVVVIASHHPEDRAFASHVLCFEAQSGGMKCSWSLLSGP